MSRNPDRLYELLPAFYRRLDDERGQPLRALLQIIAEQVEVVEDDIHRLYDNWFLETCEEWAVPYIADLIGYRAVSEAGRPGAFNTAGGARLNSFLVPRREVLGTIALRKRKGSLALLEELAAGVAGWPARAVEFYRLLGLAQHLNHPRATQGTTLDLRRGEMLDRVGGPFDEAGHTPDV